MKNKPPKLSIIVATTLMLSTSAFAVDTKTTAGVPDLTSVRAKIEVEDFAAAIDELTPMLETSPSADVYNLMGFSLRKSGDLKQAQTFYSKALDFDPNHKGALEYQGELYLQIGDISRAKANLTKLAALCPTGCEERGDLEAKIAAAATVN
ncbi:MAG: tetratricopeptide repeat protein [Aestuariivirga sp.]